MDILHEEEGCFKDKVNVCAEEWIVESLTGNVPDFERRLQVYFWKH